MPSSSAKINFLLGIERSKNDDILGKIIRVEGFKNVFWNLTVGSIGLREPVPLFREYSEEEKVKWRNQFGGVMNV